jgi:hypothetical protein
MHHEELKVDAGQANFYVSNSTPLPIHIKVPLPSAFASMSSRVIDAVIRRHCDTSRS